MPARKNRPDKCVWVSPEAQRREVLKKYARMKEGKLIVCLPSQAEISGERRRKEHQNADRKVIYNDLEMATQAAQELESTCGSAPMYAYPCKRSNHGHYHLTKKERAASYVDSVEKAEEGSDR